MLWGSRLGGLLAGDDHFGDLMFTWSVTCCFSELPQDHPIPIVVWGFVSPCITTCVLDVVLLLQPLSESLSHALTGYINPFVNC